MHTHDVEQFLPRIAEGSEHRVFFGGPNDSVYKLTLPGTFGDSYEMVKGRVHQRRCAPFDYLERLRLWDQVFGLAPRALGISESGQFISLQEYISGELPDQQEIDNYLQASGFEDVMRRCFVWKKHYPDELKAIWVGDTRDENFVRTPEGLVPIDVRLWIA